MWELEWLEKRSGRRTLNNRNTQSFLSLSLKVLKF